MHKIISLIAICSFVLSCSESENERAYDPGKPVISRPYIMAPLGKLAFKLEGKKIYLDDAGDHILGNGTDVDVTSISRIKLQITGSDDLSFFQINTKWRSETSPVQESLTLSVIDAETEEVLFYEQNTSKSGDDLFIFRNIDVDIPTIGVNRIFIRVINEADGGIWSRYIQPAWTILILPTVES